MVFHRFKESLSYLILVKELFRNFWRGLKFLCAAGEKNKDFRKKSVNIFTFSVDFVAEINIAEKAFK